jgi:hypothetical protein
MLSTEQARNIAYLFRKFLESEAKGWCALDDYLELLEYLDDDQLYREAEVLYSIHKTKNMGCSYIHKEGTKCWVVDILDAVEAITELYKETGNLHIKNRYVLANYLALCQDQQIIELPESSAY